MPLPVKHGGRMEEFLKDVRAFITPAGESLIEPGAILAFEKNAARRSFYGCLQPGTPGLNFNYASIPHPSAAVRHCAEMTKRQLLAHLLSREDREQLWQEAREQACRLIHHPDPRGVILAGNTTQALSLFHWLSGMTHPKNRVAILPHVLTTDIEHSAVIRTIATIGEDGNAEGNDCLTTHSNWRTSQGFTPERRCSLSTFRRLSVRGRSEAELLHELERRIRPTLNLADVPDVLLLSHVDRETGRAFPIQEIIAHARALKAKADPRHPHLFAVVDGAQALGNLPSVDWEDLDADMYVASPHKTMGSERIGIGYFNPDHPLVREGMELLRTGEKIKRYQPLYDGMFHADLQIPGNLVIPPQYLSQDWSQRMEINPIEVAAFIQAMQELESARWKQGNDFSALDAHRKVMRSYCIQQLQQFKRRTGIAITFPAIDRPTNFILAFRIGPEKPPKRALSLFRNLLPERWQPEEPEQFGQEIGRRLLEFDAALAYFQDSNFFRLSFDRETKEGQIDQLIAKLEFVLGNIPELRAVT